MLTLAGSLGAPASIVADADRNAANGQAAVATRPIRMEAGPQTGLRFASTGAVLASKPLTLAARTVATTDRRHAVPGRTGMFLHMASGPLVGWDVRESALAHIPGPTGVAAYPAGTRVRLGVGRFLGYSFETDWSLGSTTSGAVVSPGSAATTRRAVIDGRPYVWIASGRWAGRWMPVSATRGLVAQPLTCSVPARPGGEPTTTLRRVATTQRAVALTFDMGGRLVPALAIVERLVIDRVCATFFPTGDAIVTTQGRAAMALVRAHPELFEVGNHTQHHCNLRDGGGAASGCPGGPAGAARIHGELLDAEAVIRTITGRESAPYWRPPYGASDNRIRAAAAAVGFGTTVLWDIDTIDWRPINAGGPTAAAMAAKVVTGARPGAIVLMHLGGYQTFDALPSMVARLRARGLQPSTVSDLLH